MHVADDVRHPGELRLVGVDDESTPSPSTLRSPSVTSAAISMSASRCRSRPVISQSIHTRRSFTRPAYSLSAPTSWQTTRVRLRRSAIAAGYAVEGGALELGTVVVDGQVDPEARVRIPLAMLNRHGLVAGATGTGKTKTLQALAGQLSDAGVPVLLADVKGDLSGMARPGEDNARVQSRAKDTGDDWTPTAYPVEFLSLGGKSSRRCPIRATLTQFGPILLSKVLDLNDTQESTLGLIFHWADQRSCRCSTPRTCAPSSSTSPATRARPTSRASAASRPRRPG